MENKKSSGKSIIVAILIFLFSVLIVGSCTYSIYLRNNGERDKAYDDAINCLDYTYFSRKKLIEQLTSEYMNYSERDAERAIFLLEENEKVDWNAQALRAAKMYITNYNCTQPEELINQLTSDYDGFTIDEAHYAAMNTFGKIKSDTSTNTTPTKPYDSLANSLMMLGFTEPEAQEAADILRQCGINSIAGCEPTSSSGTIDNLVAYRLVLDKDRIVTFTIDHRKLFYVSLNGTDLYDSDKGGFIMGINDVYVPETDMTEEFKWQLLDITEDVLDTCFANMSSYYKTTYPYYDAFGFGREDNKYMAQCEADVTTVLGVKKWVQCKVWYEYVNGKMSPTAVVIDGQRIK